MTEVVDRLAAAVNAHDLDRMALAFEMRGVTLFEVTGGQIAAGRLYLEDVEQDVVDIEQAAEGLSSRRPRPAHQ